MRRVYIFQRPRLLLDESEACNVSFQSILRLVQTEGGRDAAGVRYAESVRPAGDRFVHIEYGLRAIPVFNELCIFLI